MVKLWAERKSPINEDFEKDYLFRLFEKTKHNVLITGAAGTGKSTILKKFCKFSKKKYVVLAPTGIAATNVNGQTIHKFFKFGRSMVTKEDIDDVNGKDDRYKPKIYERVETIIIDEISMVRRDIFDAMDQILRKYQLKDKPFGGVQLILFGDMYQLPPVVTEEEGSILCSVYDNNSNYFFNSNIYPELSLIIIRLNHIYRQSDGEFIEILNRMQNKLLTKKDLGILNKQVKPGKDNSDHVILCTKNNEANNYNSERLEKLPNPAVLYEAYSEGNINIERDTPAIERLILKVGSRVMTTVNSTNPFNPYFNGSLGTVTRLSKDYIEVKLDSDKTVTVTEHTFNKIAHTFKNGRIVKEQVGIVIQLPIKLAWAMTIHKSQGQTLEKVFIDFKNKPWAHGQTYVAFSRVRSLTGLMLEVPLQMLDVRVDDDVREWELNSKKSEVNIDFNKFLYLDLNSTMEDLIIFKIRT